jgi:hypothetical protein
MAQQFFAKFTNIKFHQSRFALSRVMSCVRTDDAILIRVTQDFERNYCKKKKQGKPHNNRSDEPYSSPSEWVIRSVILRRGGNEITLDVTVNRCRFGIIPGFEFWRQNAICSSCVFLKETPCLITSLDISVCLHAPTLSGFDTEQTLYLWVSISGVRRCCLCVLTYTYPLVASL